MAQQVDISDLLDISHLDGVLDVLKLVPKRKWQELGLKLGLLQTTLDTIEANYTGDVERCLKECLFKWLMKGDNVDEYGQPTLLRLADALEEIGDKATADKIRDSTSRSRENGPRHIMNAAFPELQDLKSAYLSMIGRFGELLVDIVMALLEKATVEDVKLYLLALEPGVLQKLESVNDGTRLMAYLRERCNLSNFSLLLSLMEKKSFKLESFKNEVECLERERDDFYQKVLATDFAKLAIEDHKTSEGQTEISFKVSWNLQDTTLREFEEFLNTFFQKYRIFISLKSVHHSLLTFVCTIPSWLVEEIIAFVERNIDSLKSNGVVEICVDSTVIPVDLSFDTRVPTSKLQITDAEETIAESENVYIEEEKFLTEFNWESIKSQKMFTSSVPQEEPATILDIRRSTDVVIDGEEYSLLSKPPESSSLVREEKKKLLGSLDLEQLVKYLGHVGSFIRIAYNGIGAAGPKFIDLQIEIQRLCYDITKLCDKSAVTVASFESTSETVLDELECTYQYLLDGYVKVAIVSFANLSELAKMSTAAYDLQLEFENQEKKVTSTLETTQRKKATEEIEACGALRDLSAIMMQAALFWQQLSRYCEILAQTDFQHEVEKALAKHSEEEKRRKFFTSQGFIRKAAAYYSRWVALSSVCEKYSKQIQLTQRDLYKYIKENPTRDESRKRLPILAKEFENDLQLSQKAIAERDFEADEEMKMLKDN